MRSFYSHPFQAAASYLGVSLLAVGTLAAGQSAGQSNVPPQQGSQPSTPQVSSSGGWKRVGDSPDQAPPPPAGVESNPAGQSGPAPGQNPAVDQPVYQEPPPAAGAPQSSGPPPQPYGQPGYNEPPYSPQQQPPSYGSSQAPNGQGQPSYQQGQPEYPQGQYNYPQQSPAPYGPAAPQAAVPPQLWIPAGTFVTIRVNQFLSSDRNQQGDPFSASLIQPLVVNGVVVAEPGQTIEGRVVESQRAGRVEGTSRLRVELTELTLVDGQQVPIRTQLIDRKGDTSVGLDVAGVASTAGLGAAIGATADWGRGAAIGAGAGAAVGVLGVLLTRGQPSIIAPEQALTFRLEAPVPIYTDRAPQAFRYVQPNEYDRPTFSQPPYPASRPQYAGAPYGAPYPYPYARPYPYGYPYYPPFYYGPSLSFFWGPRYYGRPYAYGNYGRPGTYVRPIHR